MGIFVFFTEETGAERAQRLSFWVFCDLHLWCQVSRTLPQYFQSYRLFSILTLFSRKQYDIITDIICIIENGNIFKTNEIFQKEKRHSSVF